MPDKNGLTAGELHRKCMSDATRYDALEIGHELASSVIENVRVCIERNLDKIDVDEFCVVMLMCDDCILSSAKRRKFYAWPFLPAPRPRQTVFHFDRRSQDIRRLWSLPTAKVMATISEMPIVDRMWAQTKSWCDAFYGRAEMKKETFYEFIRRTTGCKMLSEEEHVANLKKLGTEKVHLLQDEIDTLAPESFDFFKPFESNVVHSV
jgi:hypothetical protein